MQLLETFLKPRKLALFPKSGHPYDGNLKNFPFDIVPKNHASR